ncbi:hypothetical protein DXB08_23685 [Hungatella hathewayi]|uniref:hypothetical protein n=1 Tax=Hungatella hathewayi TaxID=154046 RepID=UPI000E43C52F|nr:hypothetical protein [Hungatella hathewayi]RGO68083.1 hypothetical protein DXB08_23685 [Hungatella hathewayi]
MKTKRIIKKMIVVGCCLCFLAGCSAKKDMTKEQTSVVMEDGSVSLKNLYFTNGDDIITDLSGENAYKQFSKMMEKQSNASGNIGEHEFSSFMIESDDTMGIACASFGEDKKLFQLTISPDYSADENAEYSKFFTLSGIRLQTSTYEDVVTAFGEPSESRMDETGMPEEITYYETDETFLFIALDEGKVNYMAVQYE